VLVVLPLTVRLGAWNGALGAVAIVVGLLLFHMGGDAPAGALLLGFDPGETPGVDWYPLLPWIGAVLAGVAIGAVLYPGGERGPRLRGLVHAPRGATAAGAPGRHSLPIYLVHQPILIVLTGIALELTGTAYQWP
jgi:uncharacterized membrane protein